MSTQDNKFRYTDMSMFSPASYPRYQFMDGPSEPPSPSAQSPTDSPASEIAEEAIVMTPPASPTLSAQSSTDSTGVQPPDEPLVSTPPGPPSSKPDEAAITHHIEAPILQNAETPTPTTSERTNGTITQPKGNLPSQPPEQSPSSTPIRSQSSPTSTSATSSFHSSDQRAAPDNGSWYAPTHRNARFIGTQVGRGPTQSPPRHIQIARNDTRPKRSKSKKYFTKSWHDFKHWLHLVWLDLLVMAIALVVSQLFQKHVPTFRKHKRFIPMVYNPTSEMWEGPVWLAYPRLNRISQSAAPLSVLGIASDGFIIAPIVVGIILGVVGFVVVGFMQIWVRDGWDFTAATLGILKAMLSTTLIGCILKKFIGKMRPNFLDCCILNWSPPIPKDNELWKYNRQWATTGNCVGNETDVAFGMEAFPSGHTASSFAVGIFLALYLNAKLKAFSTYHTSFWKMLAVFAPVLGASFIAASVYIDNNHAVEDIVYSIAIAEFVALMSYRAHYASVFNYKTNHMHLPWSSTHKSLDAKVPVPDTDSETEKPSYRFKHKNNGVAVVWPRKRENSKPDDEKLEATTAATTPSIGGGPMTGLTGIGGAEMGAMMAAGDGGQEVRTVEHIAGGHDGIDERPAISLSIRNRARYDISDDRLKYRRSKGKYTFSRHVPAKKSVEDIHLFGSDRNATIRPSRMRLLSRGSEAKGARAAKRSAGTMV